MPTFARSWYGVSEFQRSLEPMGTTASLVNGMPRRDTWIQSPDSVCVPSPFSTRMLLRLAEAHTPITKSPSRMLVALLTRLWSFCSSAMGISSAMVDTFLHFNPSDGGVFGGVHRLDQKYRRGLQKTDRQQVLQIPVRRCLLW